MFCCRFLFLAISGRPVISTSTRSIFANFFRVGRIMVVNDQSEISFSKPRGTLPWQSIFVDIIHTTEFW